MPVYISSDQIKIVSEYAKSLGVDPSWLKKLIFFESSFNPQAKNSMSSAKGLIQFTDATAKSLGFSSSQNLIDTLPTIEKQLTAVYTYLSQFKPFSSASDLYLSVFYPAARKLDPKTPLPEAAAAANPQIETFQDYIDKVNDVQIQPIASGEALFTKKGVEYAAIAAGAALILFFLIK